MSKPLLSRRESHREACRDVGCHEAKRKSAGRQEGTLRRQWKPWRWVAKTTQRSVHQLQQATGRWLSSSRSGRALCHQSEVLPTIRRSIFSLQEDAWKSTMAAANADKQSSSRLEVLGEREV